MLKGTGVGVPAQPLDSFLPPVADWFRAALGAPSDAQVLGWPAIRRGDSTLLFAPTGSGKTLAAFLVAIDRLLRRGAPTPRAGRVSVVYVSPLKALAVDIERNLQTPLSGIAHFAERAGVELYRPTVDVRTGDTPSAQRARMRRRPADILITTPESLYLMLTSAARDALESVETLIIDEVHALVPTKRGAHLMLSVERLAARRRPDAAPLQRIGLSATQRPLDEAARWIGGFEHRMARPVTILEVGARKELDLTVEATTPARLGGAHSPPDRIDATPTPPASVWPDLHTRIMDLVRAHRATLVFVNSRRLAERLASAVNDLAGEEMALAHHGSLSRERRTIIEDRLKRGHLRAIVATSSLELGIDMGALDLVIQVEAPPSVASGLQRIGRACHGLGGIPHGVLLPKHRQDLVACAAAAIGMRTGQVEETFYPRNPLDVLAQHIVAMAAMDDGSVPDLFDRVRHAAPFADLPRSAFDGVLDMLSGRHFSDDFAELRPRITWDRSRDVITSRVGAHRIAVTNGGTIPDRGSYGVFAAAPGGDLGARDTGRRVGELDEEMVFELRPGEVFTLGASSWRAERITADRVIVTPAPGEPGKMPFWHGDRPGRARAFGLRMGELVRRVADGDLAPADLRSTYALDAVAADALIGYVHKQVEAGQVPHDRAVVIERFVDEAGDWRIVVLCPLGTAVLAPWTMAIAARLRETYGPVDYHTTNDGFALRVPACDAPPSAERIVPSPGEIETMVTACLQGTALFAARFRECAARALLLPRRDPTRRTPLWAQRRRAANLFAVASRHPTFPIVLETYRECLRDVFDLPGLVSTLRDIAERRLRVTTVDARGPSPFAASILFSFAATFVYESAASSAERRAQALTIDFDRLRDLLGDAETQRLLDPEIVADYERGLQRMARPATSADGIHDMLLAIGDLSLPEIIARTVPADRAQAWVSDLRGAGRVVALRVGGQDRVVAAEDAAKFRDGIGIALPDGIAEALLDRAEHATRDLVARFARTHGPFLRDEVAMRLGLDGPTVDSAIHALAREGRIVRGPFLPAGPDTPWCDADVLDAIRRTSLARLRRAVEPVDARALARFLPEWQGITSKRRGRGALLAVIAELEGCPLVASALETEILPARLQEYRPWDLDALSASGEVVWAGIDALGATDGRIAFYLAEREALLARAIVPVEGAMANALRETLAQRGAVFFSDLARAVGGFPGEVLEVLWQMVWAGEVTNDTIEPLRSRALSPRRHRPRRQPRPPLAFRGGEGRWSLRASRWSSRPSDAERRTALAQGLLQRYGIVTREVARAEAVEGGFSSVYRVLKVLEDQGRVRRGYFVEGRGGAQFAWPGADERLRDRHEGQAASAPLVLAASDPANAWGAVVDWPAGRGDERPQRSAGALVVLQDGTLLGWLGRRDRCLLTFMPEDPDRRSEAAAALGAALAGLVDGSRRRALLLSKIDGVDAARSDMARSLVQAGFAPTASGLVRRRTRLPDAP
ncbi:MAG: DEAD/DEAH box helicase [Polyangiaceae bacterium]